MKNRTEKLFIMASEISKLLNVSGAFKVSRIFGKVEFEDTFDLHSMIDELVRMSVIRKVSSNTKGQDEVYVKGERG